MTARRPIILVGAGRMGSALAKGWCAAGLGPRLIIIEPSPSSALRALKRKGARINPKARDLAAMNPEAIVLAVKPQMMEAVTPAYAPPARSALVLSIAAGISLSSLARLFGRDAAIVRAMPNLPASVGQGITAAVAAPSLTMRQKSLATRLLAAGGEVVWVRREAWLDPVTAVSGSGPAYVFLLAEALAKAGREQGLPAALSDQLARATVIGSGALLGLSADDPRALRDSVTSPGGTTAAALSVLLEGGGFQDLMSRAIAAATLRSRALGK